jgi:hypothetical protein
MTETEGYLEVDGGRVWYRSVGEGGTPRSTSWTAGPSWKA